MLKYKYNPQNATPEELQATFTGRDDLLKNLLKEIKQQALSKSNQHYLVIGPRGIGKTNFLRMIYLNIKDDAKLSKHWIPLQFAEEEYSIGNLRDFFQKTIQVLNEEFMLEEIENFLEDLQQEEKAKHATEKAIEFLKEFSKKEKKKIVLLVDNLDLILGDQFKDDIEIKRLRDILMNKNFLTLIGASPTYFGEVSNYDKPLYNFFKIINLDDFTDQQIEEFIRKRALFDGNTQLEAQLPEYRSRLKALRHLTGGNPRLVLMLYQLLTHMQLTEVKDYLEGLLDDLTPYYQYKLRWLSPQQRKIIDGMAQLDRAGSPTEIGKITRLGVNTVSSNLKRLMDWGYVKLAQQERRKTSYYIISERLFRIWHQMRRSAGMRKKIQFLVEFIQIWYSLEEMEKLSEQLKKDFYFYISKKDMTRAKGTLEFLNYIAVAKSESDITHNVMEPYSELGDYSSIGDLLIEKVKEYEKTQNKIELPKYYFELALFHFKNNNLKMAIYYYDELLKIDPSDIHSWYNRGVTLHNTDRFEEAIASFDKALEIKPDLHDAWIVRGNALRFLGRYENAIKSYERALKIKPNDYSSWYNCGTALDYLSRYEESIVCFDNALSIKPNDFDSWLNRGIALSNSGQHEEAIKSFDKAIQIKPDDHKPWYNRGISLGFLGRFVDSISSSDKALNIKPDDSETWLNRGTALAYLDRHEEAIYSFDKAIKINPNDHKPWYSRGISLGLLGRLKESILSSDKALNIKPDDSETWLNRGTALAYLDRHKEAINSFDKAIKINPSDFKSRYNHGISLIVLKCYEQAIKSLNKGIKYAKSESDRPIFSLALFEANILLSSQNILEQNYGEGKQKFISALNYLTELIDKEFEEEVSRIFVDYFSQIVSAKRIDIVPALRLIMQEKQLENHLSLIAPFSIASIYWKKGRDPEILDRLNPEVREIVEAIIDRADKRDKRSKKGFLKSNHD